MKLIGTKKALISRWQKRQEVLSELVGRTKSKKEQERLLARIAELEKCIIDLEIFQERKS